jgi:phage baseplate assembly protein gpV
MRLFALPVVFAACVTVVSAQTIVVKPSEPRATGPIIAEQVRISVAVNLFIAAPADESEAAIKAQEDGRRLVYDVAARECTVLRDVLASDCRLDSVNVNVQRVNGNQNFNQPRTDGFNINGNVTFRIIPK